jgi:hypothetical protein
MTHYTIAYLDESDIDLRTFQRTCHNYFEVLPFKPVADIEILIAELLASSAKAIIADYDLSEQDPSIHYTGADVIRSVLKQREYFPVFILTSYEDDAITAGDDVNIVYEKGENARDEKFLERIKLQIEKFDHRLSQAQERLLELLQLRSQRALTISEEEEAITLDSFIERSLNKQSQIPDELKTLSNKTQLAELLTKVDDLLKKIDK